MIFTMIYLFDDVSFRKESLLHDKKLQLYWKFRLQLKKFHRVLKIDQHYLNPWVDFNICNFNVIVFSIFDFNFCNSFVKWLFKLMNNRVFVKIMGNSRSKPDVRVTTRKWSFPQRIFKISVSKFAGFCRFGHIYWKNHEQKTSFFVQWLVTNSKD